MACAVRGCSGSGVRRACASLDGGASASASESRPSPPIGFCAERPDHVWALDFQFDQTADGRILELLHIVDEHTREALAIECHRRIDADATVAVLDRLVSARGRAPERVRCDNGPELTANALRDWCRFSRADTAYIEPGPPWQTHLRRVVRLADPRRAALGGALRDPR